MTARPLRPAAVVALVALLLLNACAELPRRTAGTAADALSGRMTVRVDPAGSPAAARSVSAQFELTGDARQGELLLATPLGNVLARARWQPGNVTLQTPQGESVHADLDALTRVAIGEPLPVAALFDWLRGRPWPGAPSTPLQASGFSQLGWEVDLSRFADDQVMARRLQEPPVSVRVKLDRP